MLPSIDLRIANIIKALEQVVQPALAPRERLARDQVNLCIGHLRMIMEQWRWAVAFEARSLDAMIALADNILPSVEIVWHDELASALDRGWWVDRQDLAAVEKAIVALGGVIDRIILGEDGKYPLTDAVRQAVLDYGEAQAARERAWFAGTGLDPDRAELSSIAAMMDAGVVR